LMAEITGKKILTTENQAADTKNVTLDRLRYAILEQKLVKNAIDWGHHGDVTKKVKISHVLFQDQFCFKIEDSGDGYDVQKALYADEEQPDMEEMEEERLELGLRPGGLGMTIVRDMMDDIIPNAKGNITILSKYI